MTTPETANFVAYIERLVTSTKDGTIKWSQINPSTYLWEGQGTVKPAKMTVQKTERTKVRQVANRLQNVKETNMVFQAFDGGTNKARVTLNGADDSEINNALLLLYAEVAANSARADLGFLNDVFPRK